MMAQSSLWWRSRRLWFVLAALLTNVALALWFLLASAKTSTPVQEPQQPTKEINRDPILFKKRIQEQLAKETVEQSIKNLPAFDDTVPNLASLGNNMIDGAPHTYAFAKRYYPGLNRVRKILEESRSKPDRVVRILKEKLEHATDDYKQILLEDQKEMNSRNPIVNTRWSEFEKRRIYLSSSVYLLSQFGTYEALPLMAKLFIAQEDVPKLFADQSEAVINHIVANGMLVNRLFLFYVMHRLVKNYPRDKLSPQALKRLDEYLEASKDIPDYPQVSVPSWRAAYEAWDYRITILRKDLGMDKQPHIRVHQFPAQIPYLEDFEGKPRPQVYNWFAKMKPFIEEACRVTLVPASSAPKEASK
jgi:hypothetical protein